MLVNVQVFVRGADPLFVLGSGAASRWPVTASKAVRRTSLAIICALDIRIDLLLQHRQRHPAVFEHRIVEGS